MNCRPCRWFLAFVDWRGWEYSFAIWVVAVMLFIGLRMGGWPFIGIMAAVVAGFAAIAGLVVGWEMLIQYCRRRLRESKHGS